MLNKKLFNFSILSLTLALASCASSPEKMQASYVSPMIYNAYTCEQIGLEKSNVERRTNQLYQTLKSEADADKWQMGVGMLLFWPALFSLEGGDSPAAADYRRLKGEYEALQTISVQKSCGIKYEKDLF